jgi:DNA repair protein RadC
MKVSEIKVSYSNKNPVKIKVTKSRIIYDLTINQWDSDIIEYQEEVKIILLNSSNIVLGIYEMSKGGITGSVVDIRKF